MKATQYRERGVEELRADLIRLRREQFNLRMQRASGQLGQPHLLGETRREIARVKTILREKTNNV